VRLKGGRQKSTIPSRSKREIVRSHDEQSEKKTFADTLRGGFCNRGPRKPLNGGALQFRGGTISEITGGVASSSRKKTLASLKKYFRREGMTTA